MAKTDHEPSSDKPIGASPTRISNPLLRQEAGKAAVWAGVIGTAVLAVYISQSLLVIFGALVFAAMIDGGARLLERVIPAVPRGIRIAIVLLGAVGFFVWLGFFAGSQISREAAQLPEILDEQAQRLFDWLSTQGFEVHFSDLKGLAGQLMSGVGTVTSAITGLLGGLTSLVLVGIIGIYIVLEPRLYERGVAWMLPGHRRGEFYKTISQMAYTMRRLMAGRLLGMTFEGAFTWMMLYGYVLISGTSVPMAALLGILTGLLAFIPNIGAFISGILMILVGFSGGAEMGMYTVFVYFLVQTIDGYVLIPLIAKKTVDLAPALVLSAQLIMGILFGIMGLFLADPLLAMIKVMLERRSQNNDADSIPLADPESSHAKVAPDGA